MIPEDYGLVSRKEGAGSIATETETTNTSSLAIAPRLQSPLAGDAPLPHFPWRVIPGQQLLAETLLAADGRVTVIATGPLTNIAWALAKHPEVAQKIERVLIMGEYSIS